MSLSDIVNKYEKVLVITSNSFQLFIKQATPSQVIECLNNKYYITAHPKNWSVDRIKDASIYGASNIEKFNQVLNDSLLPYVMHPEDFRQIPREELADHIVAKLLASECAVEVTYCYADTNTKEAEPNSPAEYVMSQLIAGLEAMKKKKSGNSHSQ